MKLYYSPGSCSLAAHILIRELELRVEIERVSLSTKKTASGEDFLKINPKGYVPALLLDDGAVLTEGLAVLEYLGDQSPKAALVPAPGSMRRYRLHEWLTFIGTELHKSFSPLFDPAMSEDVKVHTRERLAARLAYVAWQLDRTPHLLGDQFTATDAYLFTVLRWARFVRLDLSPWPSIIAHHERILGRPHVQAALKAENLLR